MSRDNRSRLIRILFACMVILLSWTSLASNAWAGRGYLGETNIPPGASIGSVMCADPVAAACVIQAERANRGQGIVPGTAKTKFEMSLDLCKSMYLTYLVRNLAAERNRTLVDLFAPTVPVAAPQNQASCQRIVSTSSTDLMSTIQRMDLAFYAQRLAAEQLAAPPPPAHPASSVQPPPAPPASAVDPLQDDIAELDRLERQRVKPTQSSSASDTVLALPVAKPPPEDDNPYQDEPAMPANTAPLRHESGALLATAPTPTLHHDPSQIVVPHRATTSQQLRCVADHTELQFATADKLTFYVDAGAQTDELLNCLGPAFKREAKREYIDALPSVNTIPWCRQNRQITLDPVRGNPVKALKTDLNGPPNKEFLDDCQNKGGEIGFALQGRQRITFTANVKTGEVETPPAVAAPGTPPDRTSRRLAAGRGSLGPRLAPAVPATPAKTAVAAASAPPLGYAFAHDRTTRFNMARSGSTLRPAPAVRRQNTDRGCALGNAGSACSGTTKATSPP